MDGATSHTPCAGEPHARLHPLQAGADRRWAGHQAIHGGPLGQPARCAVHSIGGFAGVTRLVAQSLGPPVALARTAGLEAGLQSSGTGNHAAGKEPGLVFLARTASRGPHHGVEKKVGMVVILSGEAASLREAVWESKDPCNLVDREGADKVS